MTAERASGPPASPFDLSRRQWRGVLARTWRTAMSDQLGTVAGSVAFFGMLALFPALAATVALYGLIGDPRGVGAHVAALRGVVPDPALQLAQDQLTRLVQSRPDILALSGLTALLVSLWSALAGARSFIRALTLLNGRRERRGFFRHYLVAGAFGLSAIGIALFTVLLMTVAPRVLEALYLTPHMRSILQLIRWTALILSTAAFATALYRWGPARRPPHWRWIWPGAVLTTVVWLAASAAFSYYVSAFARLGNAYGSFAGIIALMLWTYLSSLIFLIGGELTAELERCAETGGD